MREDLLPAWVACRCHNLCPYFVIQICISLLSFYIVVMLSLKYILLTGKFLTHSFLYCDKL